MKVLMLVTSLEGGGGGSAYRLLQGVNKLGVDCRALVQDDRVGAEDPKVIRARNGAFRHALTLLVRKLNIDPLHRYPQREKELFSVQRYPDTLAQQVAALKPDLIHLQWICNDWMNIATLGRFSEPIVFTCHDMWPFTGGCHYSGACDRYRGQCGRCPLLHSEREDDISRRVWQRKAKALRGRNLTVVCPSRWIASCARSSSLLGGAHIEVIPNGLSLQSFRPLDRRKAREMLGLPADKRLILFGAWGNSRRKGLHLLVDALGRLRAEGRQDRLELVIFGFHKPTEPSDHGFNTHYLGLLHDPVSLAMAYASADVFAIPSIEDNLPNTAIEAIACGTPCVAFRTGGLPDIIEHRENGYLAEPYDPADLAHGLAWVLDDEGRRQSLGRRARQKAEDEFSDDLCAKRYVELYRELCPKLGMPSSGVPYGSARAAGRRALSV